MFDATTYHSDLRSGALPWPRSPRAHRQSLAGNRRCDVVIVGAGITGALVAQHLTAIGHEVAIIDREQPGRGSTAASTAMLLWEIDLPLQQLAAIYGFERAAEIYRISFGAAAGLIRQIGALNLACDFVARESLYLAGEEAADETLREEARCRTHAGLPATCLGYLALKREFGFERRAAILSPNTAEVDPVKLSQGLLARAIASGAILYDAEACDYASEGHKAVVATPDGIIEANHAVLATGYAMPEFLKPELHRVSSSWAFGTPALHEAALWPRRCLLWESSKPYLYARTTADRRILAGGEDEDGELDSAARSARAPAKTKRVLDKLRRLWPTMTDEIAFQWSGAFGVTSDGLPLIGPVPGWPNFYGAYGYGGNGITFSFLAAQLIGRMITGAPAIPAYDYFAVDRPNASAPPP
jgi:glycine/D-amino acid oxidase-like deaminating enzyme